MSKKLLLSKANTSAGIDSNVFAIYTYTGESSVTPSILPADLAYTTSEVTNDDGSITVTLKKSSAVSYPTLCSFINKSTVTDVACLRLNSSVTAVNQCFKGCTKLKSVDLSYLDMSNIVNLDSLFRECTSLESLDLDYLDVSKVTTMKDMFRGCTALTSLKVSSWTLSSCLYADNIFYDCKAITTLDLASWGLNACTSIADMFHNCSALTNLNAPFTLTNNTAMNGVFYGCKALVTVDLSTWNMSKVRTFNSCFSSCTKLTTIIGVEDFTLNTKENLILGNMFANCNSLTALNLSGWNTSMANNMQSMFNGCSSLTSLDVSSFNTCKVTNMQSMFSGCSSLTSLNLSNFDTSLVTNMAYMFFGCTNLTSVDLSSFNTSKVTDMKSMFGGCNSLSSIDVSRFNTAKTTIMAEMFKDCKAITSLNLSNFDTSLVNNMAYMFQGCNKLASLDISSFNTINVTNFNNMFYYCNSLTSVDLSNFNTENAVYMSYMLGYCTELSSIDLSNFNTEKVTKTQYMFSGVKATTIDISSFNLANCDTSTMFNDVPSTAVVKVNSSIGKTESECSFSGTFTVVDAPVRAMYTLPVTDGLVVYLDARGYETGDTYMYDYSGNGHHGRFHWEDVNYPNMFTKSGNAVCPPEDNATIKNWMDLLSGLNSTQNDAQTFVMSFIINDINYAWLFTANLAEAWNTRVQTSSDNKLRVQSSEGSTVISGETLYNVGDRVFIVVNKDFTYVETLKTLATDITNPHWRVGGTSGATIFRRSNDSDMISSSKLCMFAVYNRALTDDEVAALYSNELNARNS